MKENNNKLSHAYIIASLDEEAKENLSEKLALDFICKNGACGLCLECKRVKQKVHPDVIYVKRLEDDKGKLKKEITVDQIRSLGLDAYVMPQQAEKKVYIIKEAELMNKSAQNAILKILEEPPKSVVFILLSKTAEMLLPTIRSRCIIKTIHGKEKTFDNKEAQKFIELCEKGNALALCGFLASCEAFSADELKEFLSALHYYLVGVLAFRDKKTKIEREKAKELIELCELSLKYLDFNVSPKHILGLLSAKAI